MNFHIALVPDREKKRTVLILKVTWNFCSCTGSSKKAWDSIQIFDPVIGRGTIYHLSKPSSVATAATITHNQYHVISITIEWHGCNFKSKLTDNFQKVVLYSSQLCTIHSSLPFAKFFTTSNKSIIFPSVPFKVILSWICQGWTSLIFCKSRVLSEI